MMVPIRCPTCGKPIAHLWEKYKEKVENGEDPKKVLDELGVDRYCCRTAIMTSVDLMDIVSNFKK